MKLLGLSHEGWGLIAYRDACVRGDFSEHARRRANARFLRWCVDVVRAVPPAQWGKA